MTMGSRWGDWTPRPGPHNRAARALKDAGRAIARTAEGKPDQYTVAVTYTYDCGCRRTYLADLRTRQEREDVTPCDADRNLLTPSPAGMMIAGQQEAPE